MKNIFIILPHQLFYENSFLDDIDEIYLIEDPQYFQKNFHIQKLYLHITSMKNYYDHIVNKYPNKKIFYIEFHKCNYNDYKNDEINIKMFHPIDIKSVNNWKSKNITFLESPYFLTSENDLLLYKNSVKNKNYNHLHFYKWQRLRLNILIDENKKPEFGKWSFDTQNRNPYPKNYIENMIKPYSSKYYNYAKEYILKYFSNAFGKLNDIHYPTTYFQAKNHLRQFINLSLSNFGNTQDAISNKVIYGNHSNISSSLNIGLLTPSYVIEQVLIFYNNHQNKKSIINSIEGFIRQIIGWREYMRFIYTFYRNDIIDVSYLNLQNRVPLSWYRGTTELSILNECINKLQNYAYLHHIERLMVMNNLAILYEISYKDIYNWFMNCFIDSYDWVMVPNVLMNYNSLSNNVKFMKKMYIVSDNYLKKMSSTFNKDDGVIINNLYWNFLKKYKKILSKDYGLSRQLKNIR